jgi:hypothetical protein
LTPEGLEKLAGLISQLNAPYIAIGGAGGEVFRKATGAVIVVGNAARFRTTLSLSEGNGNYTYLALFSDATGAVGSGVKIDDAAQVFSKNQTQVLNLECRVTVQEVAE